MHAMHKVVRPVSYFDGTSNVEKVCYQEIESGRLAGVKGIPYLAP